MSKYFLDKCAVIREAQNLSLPEDIIQQVSDYADFLEQNGHEEFFSMVLEDFFTGGKLVNAPEMPEILSSFPGKEMLFLVLALAAVPLAKENFRTKNLPLSLLDEGLADIRIWCMDHLTNFGIPGLEWGHGLHWIFWRILTGQDLRFGRLECNKGFSFMDVIALKNRKSGKIQLLYNGTAALDKDGFITGDPEKICRHGVMAKKLFAEIVALPIREDGSVAEKTETFFPDEWQGFLSPGDNVLSLHIPADGRMDIEECRKSLRRMKEFYAADGYDFKAFVCSTWFLDAAMEKFAGSNSNMVKFGKLGMLLCPAAASTDVIRRVFGSGGIEGCRNKKSQLQKNLADHLTNGGIFRGGRIIIDPQTI